jgi:hypothetical protein
MVMGYAVSGISEKRPSLHVKPTMLPAASNIEAVEMGV